MIKKYKEKTRYIYALQWKINNQKEVEEFVNGYIFYWSPEDDIILRMENKDIFVRVNDYIIKKDDKIIRCRKEIFEEVYEEVI